VNARTSLVLGLVLVGASVSCTVLEDMSGYTGGKSTDSGVAADSAADTQVATDDGVDSTVTDTGSPADATTDTNVADSTTTETLADTAVADTAVADTAVADTAVADTAVADTGVDTGVDAAGCTGFPGVFGLSEIMVRAISGAMFASDRREWLEFTNYGSTTLDVSGVTMKLIGGTLERASFTFPSGTTLAAGEAVVVAIDKTTLMGDVSSSYATIRVFDLAKTTGDVLTNSSAVDVKLFAQAACATAYETATVPSRSWPIGQSHAYPVPSTTCPVSGRLTGTGTLSPPWKDATKDVASQYGTVALPGDAGTQGLYGTPGKANTGIACP